MTIEIRKSDRKTWCYERTPVGTERLAATRCETSGSVAWFTDDPAIVARVRVMLGPFVRSETTRKTRVR